MYSDTSRGGVWQWAWLTEVSLLTTSMEWRDMFMFSRAAKYLLTRNMARFRGQWVWLTLRAGRS